jgi:hypothetical protein
MQLHGALSLREDLSAVQGNTHRGYEVVLHVYDLGPVTSYVNDTVLRHIGIGAYHTGLEVLGVEWSYQGFLDAWDNPNLSGVVQNEPREHPAHQYRESIPMGESPMTEDEIDNVIDDFYDMWAANEYHIVSRNCVTFAEELAVALKVPQEFPSWVKGAAEAGKSPGLFHVADYGWSLFKWWSTRQAAEMERQAEAERLAAEAEQTERDGSMIETEGLTAKAGTPSVVDNAVCTRTEL